MDQFILENNLTNYFKFVKRYHYLVGEVEYPFRISLSSYDKGAITSYGCILQHRDRFCCLKKMFTNEYTELIRGTFRTSHLYWLFSNLSTDERRIICTETFSQQWQNHCGKDAVGEPYEYALSRWKKLAPHFSTLFNEFPSFDPEGKSRWLWHKGRLDFHPCRNERWSHSPTLNVSEDPIQKVETPLECALREFTEESNGYEIKEEWSISSSPLREIYLGSNSKEYLTNYFCFRAPDNYEFSKETKDDLPEGSHWLTKEEIVKEFPKRRLSLFLSFDWNGANYVSVDDEWKKIQEEK